MMTECVDEQEKKKGKKNENCYKKFKAWRREDEQEIR